MPQFVDFDCVGQAARLNAVALASLAAAPAAPKSAAIVTARLTNDTELRWQANTETDLAGYEVVWGETTALTWDHALFIGKAMTYTFKNKSKDNVFFGVRAIDTQGRRSPVTFPLPAR